MMDIVNDMIFQVADSIVMSFNWFFVLTGDSEWGHKMLIGMNNFDGEVSY
jgi:hypothetical protein